MKIKADLNANFKTNFDEINNRNYDVQLEEKKNGSKKRKKKKKHIRHEQASKTIEDMGDTGTDFNHLSGW